MIRLEVVHLLPEHEHPEVLAQELDHVERVCELGPVSRESVVLPCQRTLFPHATHREEGEGDKSTSQDSPLNQPLTNPVPERLEPEEHRVPLLLLVHAAYYPTAATRRPTRRRISRARGRRRRRRRVRAVGRPATRLAAVLGRRRRELLRPRPRPRRRVGRGRLAVELVDDAVGHGHELDEEEVEARGAEEGGRRVRGVVRRHHGVERHLFSQPSASGAAEVGPLLFLEGEVVPDTHKKGGVCLARAGRREAAGGSYGRCLDFSAAYPGVCASVREANGGCARNCSEGQRAFDVLDVESDAQ
ncbi:uncharacterized protein E0L32_008202 [Thyridium curvatum]|uniref:Uncharacterized protein n=1 Tax=Thyridium curvatum TaxID=1093900 RepID=A0A507ASU4_9PEZI|nr:uncharacterized protein E0L32_008202 [Thyridium curvatum]TPX10813.1 hypothetical protein E0L32_008202 [Thyridium curvatum]